MEIRQKFWGAFKKNRSILMINQYQGVPITSQATICMIGPEILALSAHPRQLERIKRERHTYLECTASEELLRAVPIAIDMQDKIVVLANFTVTEPAVRQHLHELHIRPKEAVGVDVQHNENSLPATLVDLIEDGDGPLQLRVLVQGQPEIHQKAEVNLTLKLSGSMEEVEVTGEVMRVNHPKGAGQTYLRVLASNKNPAAGQIMDYISLRKIEIEAELESQVS